MQLTQAFLALSPVGGLAVYCVTQVLASRLTPRQSPYISLALGFTAGAFLATGATLLLLVHEGASALDALCIIGLNALTYVALAFGYFNFVNLTLVSLRIRVLEELADAGGGRAKTTLAAEYGSNDVAAVRVDRLVRGGFLVERNGRLHNGKASFLLLSRIFDLLRWVILGPGHPVLQQSSSRATKGKP